VIKTTFARKKLENTTARKKGVNAWEKGGVKVYSFSWGKSSTLYITHPREIYVSLFGSRLEKLKRDPSQRPGSGKGC